MEPSAPVFLFRPIVGATTTVPACVSGQPAVDPIPSLFPHIVEYEAHTISQYESQHSLEVVKGYRQAMEHISDKRDAGKDHEDTVKTLAVLLQHNASQFIAAMELVGADCAQILEDRRVVNEFLMRLVVGAKESLMNYEGAMMQSLLGFLHLLHKKLQLGSIKLALTSVSRLVTQHYVSVLALCLYSGLNRNQRTVQECADFLTEVLFQIVSSKPMQELYGTPTAGHERWVRKGTRMISDLTGRKKFAVISPEKDTEPMFSLAHVVLSGLRGIIRSGTHSEKMIELVFSMIERKDLVPATEKTRIVRLNENIQLLKLLGTLLSLPGTIPALDKRADTFYVFIQLHLSAAATEGAAELVRPLFKLMSRLRSIPGVEKRLAYELWKAVLEQHANGKAGFTTEVKGLMIEFLIQAGSGESAAVECAMQMIREPLCAYAAPRSLPPAEPDDVLDSKLIEWVCRVAAENVDCAKTVLQLWIKESVDLLAVPEKLFGLYRLIYCVLLNKTVGATEFYQLLFPSSATAADLASSVRSLGPKPAMIQTFLSVSGLSLLLRSFSGAPSPGLKIAAAFLVNGIFELEEVRRALAASQEQVFRVLELLGSDPALLPCACRFINRLLHDSRADTPLYIPSMLLAFADRSINNSQTGVAKLVLSQLGSFALSSHEDPGHQQLLGRLTQDFLGVALRLQ